MQLESQKILITGATSGIGLELLKELYPQNSVSIIGRPSERLDRLKGEFSKVQVYEAELSNLKQVEKAAKQFLQQNGRLDILINNAAVQFTPQFNDADFDITTIETEINTNLTAPALLIALLLPALKASTNALVMNINSGLGLVPKTNSAVYCATKGGLNLLSQSLSHQFEKDGIKISQAFLPLIDTKMTQGRGTGKLSAKQAADAIIEGIQNERASVDIGKTKLLRFIMRLSPSLATNIMKKV